MTKTYEDGLRDALDIARAEQAKWTKEADAHAAKYWGGNNSECARSDRKRARVAERVAEKIEAKIKDASSFVPLAPAGVGQSRYVPELPLGAARNVTEEAFERAVLGINLYQPLLDVVSGKLDAETAPMMDALKEAPLFVYTEILKVLPPGRTHDAVTIERQYKMYEGRPVVEEL